jgi:hypothetical protein
MRQGRRYGLSAEQRAEIWRRWKAGESLHEIGRAFGKDHGSNRGIEPRDSGVQNCPLTFARACESSFGTAHVPSV